MNLVETYILEIKEEIYKEIYGVDCVIAKLKVNCYGNISEVCHITSVERWKKEKEQGYYLA